MPFVFVVLAIVSVVSGCKTSQSSSNIASASAPTSGADERYTRGLNVLTIQSSTQSQLVFTLDGRAPNGSEGSLSGSADAMAIGRYMYLQGPCSISFGMHESGFDVNSTDCGDFFGSSVSIDGTYSKETDLDQLEKKLKPLKGIYTLKKIQAHYGGVDSDLSRQGVTAESRQAFEDYIATEGPYYRMFNRYLRQGIGDAETKEKVQRMIEVFDLHQANVPKEIVLFRGSNFSYQNRFPDRGDTFGDPAFMSTSFSFRVASGFGEDMLDMTGEAGFPAILVIYNNSANQSSMNALFIRSELTPAGQMHEGEVLMRPGTNLKVIDFKSYTLTHELAGSYEKRLILVQYCGQGQGLCLDSSLGDVPAHVKEIWQVVSDYNLATD